MSPNFWACGANFWRLEMTNIYGKITKHSLGINWEVAASNPTRMVGEAGTVSFVISLLRGLNFEILLIWGETKIALF